MPVGERTVGGILFFFLPFAGFSLGHLIDAFDNVGGKAGTGSCFIAPRNGFSVVADMGYRFVITVDFSGTVPHRQTITEVTAVYGVVTLGIAVFFGVFFAALVVAVWLITGGELTNWKKE